jgi:hypothetical protein
MRILRCLTFMGLTITMTGCSLFQPKEAIFLHDAQNRATQNEVRAALGPPQAAASTQSGGSVWIYEIHQIEPGCQSTWCSTGSWCDEYVLTFDTGGILREWTRQSYLHGGELMPVRCDLGVLKSSS